MRPRLPFVLVLVASLTLVGGGVVMSELFGLAACPLCIIQRMLYLVVAVTACIGLLGSAAAARRVAGLAMLTASATGVFVAGYQSWIQRFVPDTGCSAYQTWWEELVDWAGTQVPLLFLSDGICSDPGWVFLGLSIAEWSLLCFLTVAIISLRVLFQRR